MDPTSIMITRAKLIDQRRRSVPKSAVTGLFHVEPTETRIREMYRARSTSEIFGNADLVNTDHKPVFKARKYPRQLDPRVTEQNAKFPTLIDGKMAYLFSGKTRNPTCTHGIIRPV
jgi:hypothetical protein